MSAEASNQSANQSNNPAKKRRTVETISKKKPEIFTFSKNNIRASQASLLLHGKKGNHNFSAASNQNVQGYGTPKGGKRSGQKTRRHRSLRRPRRH